MIAIKAYIFSKLALMLDTIRNLRTFDTVLKKKTLETLKSMEERKVSGGIEQDK